MTAQVDAKLPSGEVVRCELWQYYEIEVLPALDPPKKTKGRPPFDQAKAVENIGRHLLLSLVGAFGMMSVGWVAVRLRAAQRRYA